MDGYQIFTDATSDLAPELTAGLPSVEMIPMNVEIGGNKFYVFYMPIYDAPKSTGQIGAKATVSVSIKDWGDDTYTYHINGDQNPATYEEVEDGLIELLSAEEDPTFSIFSDQSVPVGEIVQIMNIAKRNHYKVILATQPE